MTISTAKTVVRAVVPKNVAASLQRLATASDKSVSRVIAEFLTEAEPAVRRLAGMLEVARQQRGLFPKVALAELEVALDALENQTIEVLDQADRAMQLPLNEVPDPKTWTGPKAKPKRVASEPKKRPKARKHA